MNFVSSEIECEVLKTDDGRIGCLTPLEYPDGDAVVVWVRYLGGLFEVSDAGEGRLERLGAVGDKKALKDATERLAETWNVRVGEDRIAADANAQNLGECIWRVASASTQMASTLDTLRPRSAVAREDEFVQVVARTLTERKLPVERNSKLAGRSGHQHSATIFVPSSEAVIEPIGQEANWNRVNATYAKFGDLAQANGFQLYSLLDDRQGSPEQEIESMLVQVSDVLTWTQHDQWLRSAFGSRDT
ncbi:MAG TPA: hypothetical protein VEQ41_00050 [Solirubrobacterales bacterium]|nr:hypothetical protein [Solirubrobacterales bacterium]